MLSKEIVENALNETNGNLREAAKLLDVKYPTFYWYVKKFNLKYTSKKPIIDDIEAMILYEKYHSLSLVAKELNCTKEGIRLVLQRIGAKIDEPVRYSFDERFFSKDSEQSFYWAGFIAADGCLKKHGNSDALSIGLSIKDKEHLEKFKKDIVANHPIHQYMVKNSKRNNKFKDTMKAEIVLLSKFLPDDLGRFNIVQRKSLIYTFPMWLIQHPLLHHFMRGYFDGDGSWYIGASKKTNQICFNIVGTKDFTMTFKSILENNNIVPIREADVRKRKNVYVLEYGGNGVTSKIRDFLYKDATVFLQRKYDLVKNVVVVERLNVTPEQLVEKMREFGDQKKMAEYFSCSKPSISRYISKFGIKNQIVEAKAAYIKGNHEVLV